MTAWGHQLALPHRNIAVRLTSINGHSLGRANKGINDEFRIGAGLSLLRDKIEKGCQRRGWEVG